MRNDFTVNKYTTFHMENSIFKCNLKNGNTKYLRLCSMVNCNSGSLRAHSMRFDSIRFLQSLNFIAK